ncbi:Methyltransferase domain-containing protein [Actinopolymorpha cephalotaxi]|uniref:Methyltransferase domain-containing protein n=1 Tax=Actinopolymorpha cephalotaxi TaxID=504797 RepID=A0A1I2N3I7_9ACTN|nr:class I SAM-dependent methyltransferase [Actinopolymorpha cephalotaxi]NYH85797.1 SAM-dependent methyltransferase [Actinopolymorpha cephalotaxi]SFF95961.1 Methyltransferase domain-containing protein [Actinopolymorpha cephalotaxi]
MDPRRTVSSTERAAPSHPPDTYEDLVADALAAAEAMSGWDFSYLQGRTSGGELSWSYPALAREAVSRSAALLDLDTGGGELLASLAPLPSHTVATECWEPNVRAARKRLEPLGVEVRRAQEDARLPVADGEFDLALNRHGAFDVDEVWRALSPGGIFLTQQGGTRNDLELNAALGAPPAQDVDADECARTLAGLENRGFSILTTQEEFAPYAFHDIAAVVYQLTVVSWVIPDFDVRRYDAKLRELDHQLRTEGPLVVHNHRYLIRAARPTADTPAHR